MEMKLEDGWKRDSGGSMETIFAVILMDFTAAGGRLATLIELCIIPYKILQEII
jgi:hypothetical protein